MPQEQSQYPKSEYTYRSKYPTLALSKTALYNTYDNSPKVQQIVEQLGDSNPINLDGLLGSSVSFIIRFIKKVSVLFGCFKRQGGGSLLFE
jgi:hypothetical protein